MGFRVSFRLQPSGFSNWISVPYFYSPEDFGTPSVVDVEDLCRDLGSPSTVASVMRWDEASSTFVSWTCGDTGTPFTLVKGTAYGVVNAPGEIVEASLLGAHDNVFAFDMPATAGSNLSWISIPYHHKIPDLAPPSGVDAADVCASIGSAATAIIRRDATTGMYIAYACASTLDTPFPIAIGTGYGVINSPGQPIAWQVPIYKAN
ncbi:MAG TPA: hypothetical protein VEK79_01280 [Thermoanaerobaculia bacterium]|nr:hypothetical protein [Thermoanaerobaculia bacterium]